MPKAASPSSPRDVKPYGNGSGGSSLASSSPKKSNPNTAKRLTPEQRAKLMEMALDKFLEHANWKEMAEATGLDAGAIRTQFSAKVNWSNLRKAAIKNA